MSLIPIDHRRDLCVPGNKTDTVLYSVEHWIRTACAAVQRHGNFFVALSGGSTPQTIYRTLTRPPFAAQVPWKWIHLFWSDERTVPPDDPDSNYYKAMDAGFNNVPIPPAHIHRMKGEIDPEIAALEYEQIIRSTTQGLPFDLIMLGIGEDGHTASLFPHTHALTAEQRLIVAQPVPQKNTWRMTMTYPCINAANTIVVYVLGAEKKEILETVLLRDVSFHEYPARHIGTPNHKALWIADRAAATHVLAHAGCPSPHAHSLDTRPHGNKRSMPK